MKTLVKTISKIDNEFEIRNNIEDPTIKFNVTGVSSLQDDELASAETAEIEITISKFRNPPEIRKYTITAKNVDNNHFPQIIDDSAVESIRIKLLDNNFKKLNITIAIQIGSDFIKIKNPLDEFHQHLENRSNTKILFSAPYGSGKTTFLDHYFFGEKINRRDYEVFKIFPVNYSVSTNEDIFKYIKTDILFQLLGTEVTFDKEEISKMQALQEFIFLNPTKSITGFIKAVMKLNTKTETLLKVIEKLEPIYKEIQDYYNEQNVNDKEKVQLYIEEMYEKEGSLFEDNFYTQIIRQLLGQLRTIHRKESVLIIEDLDRIDPDHIFRILNVISAHYDTYNFSGSSEGHHNKFGFDKIIVVCDLANIRSIFHHKYGEKTHFGGYINKYYSTNPFIYNSQEMKNFYIERKFTYNGVQSPSYNEIESCSKFILMKLASIDLISLRDLLKLDGEKLRLFYTYKGVPEVFYSTVSAPVIMLLVEYFGKEELIKKLNYCKENQHKKDSSHPYYQILSYNFIAGLSKQNQTEINYYLNGILCTFVIEYSDIHSYFYTAKPKPNSSSGLPTLNDFYDLFIENVNIYSKLKLKELDEG